MRDYKLKCKRGIDDLLGEYAFIGGAEGIGSSNKLNDYLNSEGWLIPAFKNIDWRDQDTIYKEVERRKAENHKYIEQLKQEGRYGEEYIVTISLEDIPLLDKSDIKSDYSLESYRMVFLDTKNI